MSNQQSWAAPSHAKPVVIIGAGGIVHDAHLPAYKMASIPVVVLVDIDIERARELAEEFNIANHYTSVKEAVEKYSNSVVYDIAVPPHLVSGILQQLPENATVLIQKPMGADLHQAREIRSICRSKNLIASVNFQLRYSPMMLAAKKAIEEGKIGQLLDIEVHLNIYTPWQLFPFLIPMSRVEIAVHSIHYLDSIRALAGTPKAAFARSLGDPRAAQFAQTRTTAILDYENDLRCLMSINHNHRGGRKFQSAWFRIEGSEGALMIKLGVCFDYPNGEADELWFCPNDGKWLEIPLEGSWFIESFMGPMRNLQRFAAGEDDVLYSSVEDAFHTMALVEACFESMNMPATPLIQD